MAGFVFGFVVGAVVVVVGVSLALKRVTLL